MAAYALARFTSPNAGVSVNQAVTDQYIAAAYGVALKNLDVNAVGLAIANAFTSAGSLDLSLASDTAGLKVPAKAGAAPLADGAEAIDTTTHNRVRGRNGAKVTYAELETAQTFTAAQNFTQSGSATAATFTSSAGAATVNIVDTGGSGANLRLTGDGVSTPKKTIRVNVGQLQVVNDAYGAVILSLSDAGALNVASTISSGGLKYGTYELGSATATGAQTVTSTATPGTDLTSLTVTCTPDGTHPVYVDVTLPDVEPSTNSAFATIAIQKDGVVVYEGRILLGTAATDAPVFIRYRDPAPSNASHVYKVSAYSSAAQNIVFQNSATRIAMITATQIQT